MGPRGLLSGEPAYAGSLPVLRSTYLCTWIGYYGKVLVQI